MTTLLQSIPSPMQIRAELEEMVLNDLLGPAGGPAEEVTEQSVRDRYLVGMLAPTRQNLSPEEFDELAEGGVGTVEEGSAEYTGPTAKTMFPSSFGMTFCIDAEATEFQIIARWGHYARTHSETLTTEAGNKKLVWKRSRREGVSEPIPLKTGKIRWVPDGEFHEVEVQGVIRRRDHFWSVTLFLVNGQDEPKKLRDTAWLFQPELIVQSPGGKPIFHPHSTHREPGKSDPVVYAEERELAMLYRNHVQFGVGHGVSIHAECPEGVCDRAVRISTRVVPSCEVPKTTPPTILEIPNLAGVVLDMKELGETKTAEFEQKLRPLLVAYEAWIKEREAELAMPEMKRHQEAGKAALARCRMALGRIEAGLKLICSDEKAAEAFRFANLAMWQQRVRSIYALKRRRGEAADVQEIDVLQNRSWYPFQLAFVLLNLPGITLLDHVDRTGEMEAVADLLWFPTGGGKTEAYLGLSAYTMGLRRLQGEVAGRPGQYGIAVLMRYTLRLLTIQQFQRATALICACEVIRRADQKKWGTEAFRIGLWVGQKTTPNTTEQSSEAIQLAHGQGNFKAGKLSGSPSQLTNCPWCGAKIDPGRDIKVESYAKGRCRTLTFCGDVLGRCDFSAKKSPQGLDVRDNFFSRQRTPTEDTPGRRYIGICASGRRLKVALIRVYVALLSAAQTLYEKNGYGREADPWLTLIGYFNSMRELGGMRRLVDDDVRTRLRKTDQRGLAKRSIYTVDELTSRKDSTDIPEVLDHLEVAFDPDMEARRKELLKKGAPLLKDLPKRPLDVLLATNMVSVGVDVQRLGLMVVAGQPKTMAEYIQSTSRVGRKHPGLVVTVYNWARPRDLSHYESFEHYHATFYKHVEALSVTPFALGAISRGLTALLVSCIRLQGSEFNPNKHAGRIERNHPYVKEAVEIITRRAHLVGAGPEIEQLVRGELNERLDQWLAETQKNIGGRVLGYDDERDGVTVGLLHRPSLDPWDDFTCLNSLRDVEPTVGLIFHDGGLDEDPDFEAPVSEDSDETDSDEEEAV